MALLGAWAAEARAATITWKGHTWQLTSGGMAGVCQGDPANVTVDASGYLHLRITNSGGAWTSAELFTTDKLGFGTYQWQVDGPIDTYDKNVVLGLFPYGPAAGIGADGTNEIDIEYSRWGQANGPNGDWTDYPASGTTIGELSYTFSLGGGTLSTSRFVWSTIEITDYLWSGLVALESQVAPLKSWNYRPTNPTMNIPQQALPLGMNLWCFDAPPSDGKAVEIVIRDFTFVPEGSSSGSAGAGGGAGAGGAGSGGTGSGGTGGGGAGAGGRGGAGGAGTAGAGGRGGAGGATAAGGGGGAAAGRGGGGAGSGGTGAGGRGGGGGSAGAGGASSAGTGGASGAGTGGASSAGTGGASSGGSGGASSAGSGGAIGTGASGGGRGGSSSGPGAGGSGGASGSGAAQSGGCGCGVAGSDSDTFGATGYAGLTVALSVLAFRRRRARPS